jgi:hypothetical protein
VPTAFSARSDDASLLLAALVRFDELMRWAYAGDRQQWRWPHILPDQAAISRSVRTETRRGRVEATVMRNSERYRSNAAA